MKATGIVKQIDDLGRIVIPKVIKNTFGLEDRDSGGGIGDRAEMSDYNKIRHSVQSLQKI